MHFQSPLQALEEVLRSITYHEKEWQLRFYSQLSKPTGKALLAPHLSWLSNYLSTED